MKVEEAFQFFSIFYFMKVKAAKRDKVSTGNSVTECRVFPPPQRFECDAPITKLLFCGNYKMLTQYQLSFFP